MLVYFSSLIVRWNHREEEYKKTGKEEKEEKRREKKEKREKRERIRKRKIEGRKGMEKEDN